MLKKILSFFSQKEIEEIVVKLNEIEDTFQKLYDGHIENSVVSSFDKLKKDVEEQCKIIEEKCKVLENAKLKNENIPLKEKQYMKGNRVSYIKHVRILLKQMAAPNSHEDIEKTSKQFKEIIEGFGSHTIRAKQILSHFFEHETEAIHKEVGKLNKQFDELASLIENEGHQIYLRLKKDIEKFNNSKKGLASLKLEIKEHKELLKSIEKNIEANIKLLGEKKGSDENKKSSELKKIKKDATERLSKIKTDVKVTFSKFERALKKYDRIAMDDSDWVSKYMFDSFIALSEDVENKGKNILSKLVDMIKKGSIDLKNSEKIVSQIEDLINNQYTQKMHEKVKSLKEELVKVEKELENMTVCKEIEEIEDKIESEKKKITQYKSRLKELESEIDSFSEEKHIENMESKLGKIMNKKVVIERDKLTRI